MKPPGHSLFALALIMGASIPAIANAQAYACDSTKGSSAYTRTPFVYSATNFNPPPIDFTSAKPGDPLTPVQAVAMTSPFAGNINCQGSGSGSAYLEYRGTGSYDAASNAILTNVPGVGLRVFSGTQGPFFSSGSSARWPLNITHVNGWTLPLQVTLYLQLVRTSAAPSASGGVISGEFAGMFPSYGQGVSFVFGAPVPVKPVFPTCSVAQKNIGVPLGTVDMGKFSGVNSTAGTPAAFNIALSCSGGSSGTSINAYVTLTDQTTPGNRSNVLSLSAASTATGIGIQLRNGQDKIVGFGPDSNAAGNVNQWLAQQSIGNQSINIPLTARYIQTGARVTPGSANAIATFTMSYQ
jgi:type 1 fimbria pilin